MARTCVWWCRYRGHWISGPNIFLYGLESAHKNGFVKTFTHTSIPIHPCTFLKQTESKTLNLPNMMPSFTSPLPVQCAGGQRPGSLAPAPQDCSTSEALSPRTVLTENICGCVQHRPTTMSFLTTSTITLSCLTSAAPQAVSWWLGHVEPDDVVIEDVGGQALDIFLHGPESSYKNGTVKTNIDSHFYCHPPMHTPKANQE